MHQAPCTGLQINSFGIWFRSVFLTTLCCKMATFIKWEAGKVKEKSTSKEEAKDLKTEIETFF